MREVWRGRAKTSSAGHITTLLTKALGINYWRAHRTTCLGTINQYRTIYKLWINLSLILEDLPWARTWKSFHQLPCNPRTLKRKDFCILKDQMNIFILQELPPILKGKVVSSTRVDFSSRPFWAENRLLILKLTRDIAHQVKVGVISLLRRNIKTWWLHTAKDRIQLGRATAGPNL